MWYALSDLAGILYAIAAVALVIALPLCVAVFARQAERPVR